MTGPERRYPGCFITLEGIDGAGKSTTLKWLENRLSGHGLQVRCTKEPGGTPLGGEIRRLFLEYGGMISVWPELLLLYAARLEHIEQVIRPALEAGVWIISDRFHDSTYAYQGGGRGAATADIANLETLIKMDLQPDLTLLFDVEPQEALARIANRCSESGRQHMVQDRSDWIEAETLDFHRRVRAAYLGRALGAVDRFRIVDAAAPQAMVRARLEAIIDEFVTGNVRSF